MSYAATLEPKAALKYFRGKGYKWDHWDWYEVAEATHARAFMVAKAMRSDILVDIRTAVDKALADGQTLQQFQKELGPLLQRKGWWGRQTLINPKTGKEQVVQLGSPRRLRTIFNVNTRVARSRARYHRQMENVASRPYLQYISVNDANTRPSHAAFDGKVFAASDPVWNTHYPPNDWNCRCRVRALTQAEVTARGLKVDTSKGKLTDTPVDIADRAGTVTKKNLRTITYRDSAGAAQNFTPTLGWSHNSGNPNPIEKIRVPKTKPRPAKPRPARAPKKSSTAPITTKDKTFSFYGLSPIAKLDDAKKLSAPIRLKAVRSSDVAVHKFATKIKLGLSEDATVRIKTPLPDEDVIIQRRHLRHIFGSDKSRFIFGNYLLETLENPLEIWRFLHIDRRGKPSYRRRFIAAFRAEKDRGEKNSLVVVEENPDGSLLVTFIPKGSDSNQNIDNARLGILLYERKRGIIRTKK